MTAAMGSMDRRRAAEVLGAALLRTPAEVPLDRRDPRAIEAAIELFGPGLDAWFPTDVEGFDHLPDGPSLLVGNHNGGMMVPDMFALMLAGWRRFGVELPSYGLTHDLSANAPGFGRLLGLVGAMPARHENGAAALARGCRVLVYPGGDIDTFKPFTERHVVKFGGRTGFARLAIRSGVPIVPVVSLGAHETFIVLSDGRELARRLRLKELFRLEVLPIFLALPFGLGIGPAEMHLPLPSRLLIRVLPPVEHRLPAEAADDRDAVRAYAEEVRGRMQDALDEMKRRPGYGVRARLGELMAALR